MIDKRKIAYILTLIIGTIALLCCFAVISKKCGLEDSVYKPVEYSSNGTFIHPDELTDDLLHSENMWYSNDKKYRYLIKYMMDISQTISKDPDVKGLILLADDDGVIFIGELDEFESNSKTEVSPYTTYKIGELTKTFTATAILQLAEQGRLSLDDTIDKFFTEYEMSEEIGSIKVEWLLRNKSGLYDYGSEPEEIFGEIDNETKKRIRENDFPDEEFLPLIFKRGKKYNPGETYSPSYTDYHLLALIVEKVSGKSYAEYLQENIFDVCGMKHSSSVSDGDVTSVPTDMNFEDINAQHFYRGVSDIHSCAADLISFDTALLNGKLLGRQGFNAMFPKDDKCAGWNGSFYAPESYQNFGNRGSYVANNSIFSTKNHGKFYLIQLYSTPNDKTTDHIKNMLNRFDIIFKMYYR